MAIDLKRVNPAQIDMTQPVITPILRKTPEGGYEGRLYVAIGGIAQGHIEICAGGIEPLKALINGLVGFVSTQERSIVIPQVMAKLQS